MFSIDVMMMMALMDMYVSIDVNMMIALMEICDLYGCYDNDICDECVPYLWILTLVLVHSEQQCGCHIDGAIMTMISTMKLCY